MQAAFFIEASNIVLGTSERYGPFPGTPFITHNFIRCSADPLDGSHIFSYTDPDLTDHDPDRWQGDAGIRYDGWRRCYDSDPDTLGWGQFGIEYGPFWTDLFFEAVHVADDFAFPSNHLPADEYVDPSGLNPLTHEPA